MFGFLNVDKPLGITSHDVVAKVRRALKLKKVGHAGTLDPLATGVLIICVGGATRLSDYVMHQTKRYRARIKLGETTTTYDAEGEIVQARDSLHVSQHEIENVLQRFKGEIDQVPPMFSAIKQSGRKLYELARDGVTVERESRRVTIHDLQVIDWNPPEFTLDVVCGAGTYIRSLAFDIGEALNVGAHLTGLIRTASGAFMLEQAVTLETFTNADDPASFLIAPESVLTDWIDVRFSDNETSAILVGKSIPFGESQAHTPIQGTTAMGYAPDGRLIAVLEASDELWTPIRVFHRDE